MTMHQDPAPRTTPAREETRSFLMDAAFEHQKRDRNFRIGLMIALYFTLILIWLPGWRMSDNTVDLRQASIHKPQKRKVLKPPPIEPLHKVVTKEKRARKVPMPDLTPNEPEPVVEPDPPPAPEVLYTDDWEIGIPDDDSIPEPPSQESVARVGQVGVEPPVFTHQPTPEYPRMGLKVGVEGFVILEAVLRKHGRIEEIKVLRPLAKGKLGFEKAAMDTLRQWQFIPGKVNGKPADVRMTLKVDFRLTNRSESGI